MATKIDNFKPAYAAQEVISCFKLQFYTSRTYEEFTEVVEQHFHLLTDQWKALHDEWETLQISRVKPESETHPVMLQALKPFMP